MLTKIVRVDLQALLLRKNYGGSFAAALSFKREEKGNSVPRKRSVILQGV